jgi:hypothetical protein
VKFSKNNKRRDIARNISSFIVQVMQFKKDINITSPRQSIPQKISRVPLWFH